jgi:phosphoenolpyruvate---glycerone phosphotransferase subunit DhaL
MQQLQFSDIELAVKTMTDIAIENERYFSDLDSAAGDGDFGTSLATGFKIIRKEWDTLDRSSISAFLTKISMIITGNVGGCSGPIWGTAFLRAGIKSKDKESLTLADLTEMFRSAIDGIKARGGAEFGDKTLLDALLPITDCFEEHSKKEPQDVLAAFENATAAAAEAVEVTKAWEAKRGRQSFVGERSIGTADPGIVAVATMIEKVTESLKQANA